MRREVTGFEVGRQGSAAAGRQGARQPVRDGQSGHTDERVARGEGAPAEAAGEAHLPRSGGKWTDKEKKTAKH